MLCTLLLCVTRQLGCHEEYRAWWDTVQPSVLLRFLYGVEGIGLLPTLSQFPEVACSLRYARSQPDACDLDDSRELPFTLK